MPQHITPKDLYDTMQNDETHDHICVDVRTESEYDMMHIANAINIPLEQLKSHIGEIKKYNTVYVCCASGNRSAMACRVLAENGVTNLVDVRDGMNGWIMEKLPTVGNGKARLPLMQQVLIVIGVMVMGSIIAGYFVNELFFVIPLGMSVGLLYAGLSGNCLMTKILIKMPWNR